MPPVSVSVVIPGSPAGEPDPAFREAVARYLQSAGISFEILPAQEADHGVAMRRCISESRGSVVAIVAPSTTAFEALGNAIAMIDGGAADAVFGIAHDRHRAPALLRWLLVPMLPDLSTGFLVLSSAAGKLTSGESRLAGTGWELELAYLLNKYGFRVETIVSSAVVPDPPGLADALIAAMRVRLHDRRLDYRAARRCPVCFSPDVWSCGQVPGNVVRECQRCHCRYLNDLNETCSSEPVHRVLEAHRDPDELMEVHSDSAREKTALRRLGSIRKGLQARSRLLEIGVRDGAFGALASRDYEYVGIDRASGATRHARARGLEAYCASLSNFVNTGPAFDGVAIYHVLESMADPHDALARVKELLKPGGVLFLTAFDTEGFFYLLTERQRMIANFRAHLILYSRSAVIELLERSGFEIVSVGPDFVYRDHKVLRHWLAHRSSLVSAFGKAVLAIAPDPLLVSSASINIVARRRSGSHLNRRAIRAAEPTHVR
jgi:2-polyprenyl-3-methyl-5-hydroxy-6-metoxy-1,4-benzoquinol methylase